MATMVLHSRSDTLADRSFYKNYGSEKKDKRGRQKIVKWPINEKLCEVRFFLPDDAPALLGMPGSHLLAHNVQHYPESKYSAGEHTSEAKRPRLTDVTNSLGNLAPRSGLSVAKSLHASKAELETTMTCAAPWHCPHTFILDDSWLWAAGNDSTERVLQSQREVKVFEAFYPRLASVPDSPAEPPESLADISVLSSTPLIPLEGEEDETEDVDPEEMIVSGCVGNVRPECVVTPDSSELRTNAVTLALNFKDGILPEDSMAKSVKLKTSEVMNEADSNIAAVAAAACMVVKSLGGSDLVDEKLLLAILKNPSLLKSLTGSNEIMPKNCQFKTNAAVSRVFQKPIASWPGKEPSDNGACLSASPVSVLGRWDEGVFTESPHGTIPIANTDGHTQQRSIKTSIPECATAPKTSLPSQRPQKTTNSGRDSAVPGLEITTSTIRDGCTNSPFKAPIPQECLSHADKPEEDMKLSCQNLPRSTLDTASCSMPFIAPSSFSVRSTSLRNSEHLQRAEAHRDPPRRTVAHSKTLQAKCVVPSDRGGGGRAKKICTYFNSPRGCRRGGSCAFVHQTLDSELNTMAL